MQQLENIDKIIVPSAQWRQQFAKGRVDVARLHIIHSACPNDVLRAPSTQKNRFVFVLPARLKGEPEHDCMDIVLKSMLKLQKNNSDNNEWEVRVVADELQLSNYVQKAVALGIDEHLTVLTSIKSDFPLHEVLPSAAALILPEGNPEGNVSAIMAAWCLGVPIIATQVPAHLELIEVADKIRFFSRGLAKQDQMQLISFEDTDSLAVAMQELLKDPKRLTSLAAASLAMKNYADMSRLTQSYADIYKGCIGSRGWVLPSKNS